MIIEITTTQIILLCLICLLSIGLVITYTIINAIHFYKYMKWFNNTECGRVWKKARINMNHILILNKRCYEGIKKEDNRGLNR